MSGLEATLVQNIDEHRKWMKEMFGPAWEAGDWRKTWPGPPEHRQ